MSAQVRRPVSASLLAASLALALCWPLHASQVGSTQTTFSAVGSITGPADFVALDQRGTVLYTVADRTVTVFDITTPASPRQLGAVTLPERVFAVAASGEALYAAIDIGGLAIIDASTPASPVLRGLVKIPGGALAVAVAGSTALVPNLGSGVEMVDVADMARPRRIGSYFTEGYANGVAISGSLAYVVDQPTGLYVLDVSAPGIPKSISAQQILDTPQAIAVGSLEGSLSNGGAIVVVVGGRAGTIDVFDVATPATPTKITTYDTPGRAQSIVMIGLRAYVADGPQGIQLIDFSTPSSPTIVGSFKTASPARHVAVSGRLVVAALGTQGAIILAERR